MMKRSIKLALFILFVTCVVPIFAQDTGFTFSGLMFGDYYYVATNHKDALEGQNGFWLRRVYFTADKPLSESFDVRFRLEMNSPGDFITSAKLTPFVKDAYLRWKNENYQAFFGISPSPSFEFIESFWGYRSIEKTPLDLQKMASSREFGVALRGGSKKVKFHLAFGNGAGEGSEINKGKAILGSVLFNLSDSFVAEFYGDFNALPLDVDRSTVQGFLGWQNKKGRAGVQYAHQKLDAPTGNKNLDVFSVFAVGKFNDKVAVVGRYDRMLHPNPAGESIPYIPFASTAKSNLVIAGVDITVIKNVFVQPNVEFVSYDKPETGEKPHSDVIPRITVFFKF